MFISDSSPRLTHMCLIISFYYLSHMFIRKSSNTCRKLDENHPQIVSDMLEYYLQNMTNEDPRVRALCVKALNHFILLNSEILNANMSAFLDRLYSLTSDQNEGYQNTNLTDLEGCRSMSVNHL